jgi:hypothetical protein
VKVIFAGLILAAAMGCWAADLNSTESNHEQQAVDAVRGLRSVVTSGVVYKDYATRILDARVQIDRYLESKGGNTTIRSAVSAAMMCYEIASTFWNATLGVNPDRISIAEDERFVAIARKIENNPRMMSVCPFLPAYIKVQSYPFSDPTPQSLLASKMVTAKDEYLQKFWTCAAEQVKVAVDKAAQ